MCISKVLQLQYLYALAITFKNQPHGMRKRDQVEPKCVYQSAGRSVDPDRAPKCHPNQCTKVSAKILNMGPGDPFSALQGTLLVPFRGHIWRSIGEVEIIKNHQFY